MQLAASYAVMFAGLGLAAWATLALENEFSDLVRTIGFIIALLATFFVCIAMFCESKKLRAIPMTWIDSSYVAADEANTAAYRRLPRAVRWWRIAFRWMFGVALTLFIGFTLVVSTQDTSPGVLFLALFLLIPAYLARRYSEDLMRLWHPRRELEHTLDPLSYIKGTTTGREVFGYWCAFLGLAGINLANLGHPVFPQNIVTPVLVLLSIGSTAKMLSTGHKEMYEARESVEQKIASFEHTL